MFQALVQRRLRTFARSLPRSGDFIVVAVGVFVIRLMVDTPVLIIGLPGLLYWIKWLDKRLLVWTLILATAVLAHVGIQSIMPVQIPDQGIIQTVDDTRHYLKSEGGNFYLYTGEAPLPAGTVVSGDFMLLEAHQQSLVGGFDQAAYFAAEKIQGTLYADTVTVLSEVPIRRTLSDRVRTYIDAEFSDLNGYMTAFFIGENTGFDDTFNARIRALGISHIFAVSGLHVGLLALFLEALLKRFKPAFKLSIIGLILTGYIILTQFSISLIRAVFIYGFIRLNHSLKGPFTPLDGLAMILCGSLLVHPFIIYHPAFLLSYSVTVVLLMMAPTLKTRWAPIYVSIYAFMTTLPIIMSMSGSVNVASLGLNVLAVFVLGSFLLPLTYVSFFVPALEPLVWPLFAGFEVLVNAAYTHLYWPISVPFVFGGFAGIYYLAWGVICVVSHGNLVKLSILSASLLTLFACGRFGPLMPQLTMLDVDGDAFLYQAPFNQCTLLVDGGRSYTAEALKTHLKNHGVTTIDVIITTHYDADHHEGIDAILNDSYFKTGLHITPDTLPETLSCGPAQLTFDQPALAYPSRNNRSVAFLLDAHGWQVLLTGDIEAEREVDFWQGGPLDVDLLKVSHHGSKSSTSEAFLTQINADIALINLPHSSRFEFPHPTVIDQLNAFEMTIYRTDYHGTTRFILGPKWLLPWPAFRP